MIEINTGTSSRDDNPYDKKLRRLVENLTERKKEVYDLAIEGYSTREIAEQMFLSIETVRTHRKHIVQEAEAKDFHEIRIWVLKSKANSSK